ncbi:hypothetical protein ACWCQK_37715 [Streptomyces sp. NPDC002306]
MTNARTGGAVVGHAAEALSGLSVVAQDEGHDGCGIAELHDLCVVSAHVLGQGA